jgi:hypothetical protein
MAGEIALSAVNKLCYLGSILSADVHIDDDIYLTHCQNLLLLRHVLLASLR